MKRILLKITVLALFVGLTIDIQAQCSASDFADVCIPKLQSGFNFVKSYQIDGHEGQRKKVEYSYVFAKGTQYMLDICTGGENTDGIVLTLFDSNRKMVSSNKASGKLFSAIAYQCNSTGIYYLTFTFDKSKEYCGGAVLGFKR